MNKGCFSANRTRLHEQPPSMCCMSPSCSPANTRKVAEERNQRGIYAYAPVRNPIACLLQRSDQFRDARFVLGARLKRAVHVDSNESRQVVGLHLGDAIHVGADDGTDHGVAAASD